MNAVGQIIARVLDDMHSLVCTPLTDACRDFADQVLEGFEGDTTLYLTTDATWAPGISLPDLARNLKANC